MSGAAGIGSTRSPDAPLAFARLRLEVEDPAAAGVAPTVETESTAENGRKLETFAIHRRRLVTVRAAGVDAEEQSLPPRIDQPVLRNPGTPIGNRQAL